MPKLIQQETLCCGHKRCPVVQLFDDGSMRISDDDTEKNSLGTIKLEPDQVARIVELVSKNKR